MSAFAAAIGRILLALIFIVSGFNKLLTIDATEALITGVGLPAGLALPTAIFEIVAGLCLAFGLMTRLASLLLIGFTALATLFFHREFTDPMQLALAMKNVAIMGGLLLVFAYGHMRWSYDYLRAEHRGDVRVRKEAARAHEAELRAARAEGRVAGTSTTVVHDDDVVVHEKRPLRERLGF